MRKVQNIKIKKVRKSFQWGVNRSPLGNPVNLLAMWKPIKDIDTLVRTTASKPNWYCYTLGYSDYIISLLVPKDGKWQLRYPMEIGNHEFVLKDFDGKEDADEFMRKYFRMKVDILKE